jgi:hypothetical protein
MRKGIGRNDSCPCGSGKKYKKYSLGNGDQDTTSEFHSKYRFEAGSYGDVGSFMPSIACLKLTQSGAWIYHFVLVNPKKVLPEEDGAAVQAGEDLSVAFELKNERGMGSDMAMDLKSKGYVTVDDFNIVGSSKFQA